MSKPLKVCYVLSYKDPQYTRSQTLLASLGTIKNIRVFTAINTSRGMVRYLETLIKLLAVRLKWSPDIYILGFRGLEIFWLVRIITFGKPLIYDEFIEPINWFTVEHKKFQPDSIASRLLKFYQRSILNNCSKILADTTAHAELSAQTSKIDLNKYLVVPVGTDESIFKPLSSDRISNRYEVLFYGSMLPLHGIKYIVDSLRFLDQQIILHLVGDISNLPDDLSNEIQKRIDQGRIIHTKWIPLKELPKAIARANISLGGPFGGTPQAMLVITGKTFQSLAMGKLTLVGKTNVQSVLTDGRNCLIVEQGSGKAIAQKIIWAINHSLEAEKIATNGRKTYLDNFSNTKIAQLLSPLFNIR